MREFTTLGLECVFMKTGFDLFPHRAPVLFSLLLCALPGSLPAHEQAWIDGDLDEQRLIRFPDTATHITMVVDLHTHSVFSDGHVWPRTRVEEALRDGLDALAITEHLEWTPHLADLRLDDRNRAWQIAHDAARDTDLLVINGSEITREAPAGHINAIFLSDANRLLFLPDGLQPTDDVDAFYAAAGRADPNLALQAAADQGAFVFLNHPAYSAPEQDEIARLSPFQLQAIERQQLHGIEVVNGNNVSDEAFQLALDHGLTLLGVSDVHELIDWDYPPHSGGHRPVTLVLSETRSAEALQQALFAGRTVVWSGNTLLGLEENLRPLLEASIVVEEAYFEAGEPIARVNLRNHSDARFILANVSDYSFDAGVGIVEIEPHGTLLLGVRTGAALEQFPLRFRVLNALTTPRTAITMTLPVNAEQRAARPEAE